MHVRTTCRRHPDDICHPPAEISNEVSLSGHPHVIRTSSACRLPVVCTRFQPQIYFPLKSIAGTALLKIKKRNLLIVTELVVSGTQCILVMIINWEVYIKIAVFCFFSFFKVTFGFKMKSVEYYVSRFELYKLKGVHYETSSGSRFSQKRGCQP